MHILRVRNLHDTIKSSTLDGQIRCFKILYDILILLAIDINFYWPWSLKNKLLCSDSTITSQWPHFNLKLVRIIEPMQIFSLYF